MERSTQESNGGITRRALIKAGAASAFTAASWAKVAGANERVGVGIIGFGLIGSRHTRNFKAQDDVDMVAVAETHRPRLDAAADLVGGVTKYHDFRSLLENKDIDAVVISTPDHWHALMSMMACAAGKDVYVEKPLTLFVNEGRWLADVAKKHKRVVQVGTQQRSGAHYQKARQLVQDGHIGDLVSVQVRAFRNVMPGFGNPPDTAPPPELDWDLWLGPAPMRQYNPNRAIYHFRWFWDYSGGQMTNLGQHSLDIVQWFANVNGPETVSSSGGRWHLTDNGEVPDVQDAVIQYPGFTATCQYRECAEGDDEMPGLVFFGTKGSLQISRRGFSIMPDAKRNPHNVVAHVLGTHPVGGPQPVDDAEGDGWWTKEMEDDTGDWEDQYIKHTRNFLECIKSRSQPIADVESGHRIVTTCHLSNISLRTGSKVVWDADREKITGNPQAEKMLERPYRKPWDRELRSLIG